MRDSTCAFCGNVLYDQSSRARHERRCPKRNGRSIPKRQQPARSDEDVIALFASVNPRRPIRPQLRAHGIPEGAMSQLVRRARKLAALREQPPPQPTAYIAPAGGGIGGLLERAGGTERPNATGIAKPFLQAKVKFTPPLQSRWDDRGSGDYECKLCKRLFRTEARARPERHLCEAQDERRGAAGARDQAQSGAWVTDQHPGAGPARPGSGVMAGNWDDGYYALPSDPDDLIDPEYEENTSTYCPEAFGGPIKVAVRHAGERWADHPGEVIPMAHGGD